MWISRLLFLLLACLPLWPQSGWFEKSQLNRPEVSKALHGLDGRAPAIVEEWIRLVEIPAPSGKEQARAEYMRVEMEKLGLTDIRTDELSNVSGVRKGTGGGPAVVFAAHMDTVFPAGTNLKVKREGDILRAPGVGDDAGNLIAILEMCRALNRGAINTRGDIILLASAQEEAGLLGAMHWLKSSGYKPDMFVALDVPSNVVWYGALRVDMLKFFYTSQGAHTLTSRGAPNPARAVAKAISALFDIPLPPVIEGLGDMKLPTLNVGMLGGGSARNAIPREAWFTVDLRSLDTSTQDRLLTAVVSTARRIAEQEGVGFRMERDAAAAIDYSKALPQKERLNHPLLQTALATSNYFRKPGTPEIVPMDVGSNDSNIAVSMGIPAVVIGATIKGMPHQLEEYAEASSIVPGIKSLVSLAVALTNH